MKWKFLDLVANSRDDFRFFVKSGGSCEGASITANKALEECELTSADGDNKDEVVDYNKHQMLANMNKWAADIAYSAVSDGILITVFGMLVDYKSAKTTKS